MNHKVDHFSATLGVIQDYGNAGSHNAPQPKQPNQKQVASNPYDFCLVICHRLIYAYNLLVNEIAPKDTLGRPNMGNFPVGTNKGLSHKKVVDDRLSMVRSSDHPNGVHVLLTFKVCLVSIYGLYLPASMIVSLP